MPHLSGDHALQAVCVAQLHILLAEAPHVQGPLLDLDLVLHVEVTDDALDWVAQQHQDARVRQQVIRPLGRQWMEKVPASSTVGATDASHTLDAHRGVASVCT